MKQLFTGISPSPLLHRLDLLRRPTCNNPARPLSSAARAVGGGVSIFNHYPGRVPDDKDGGPFSISVLESAREPGHPPGEAPDRRSSKTKTVSSLGFFPIFACKFQSLASLAGEARGLLAQSQLAKS